MKPAKDLQFEFSSGCLTVRASGRYMIEQKEAALRSIAAAIQAQPVRAILADLRQLDGPYTFIDRYELGELTARFLSHVPVAALAREAQTDPKRIGQTVAQNRGARLEVFTDPAEAERWLAGFAKPEQPPVTPV